MAGASLGKAGGWLARRLGLSKKNKLPNWAPGQLPPGWEPPETGAPEHPGIPGPTVGGNPGNPGGSQTPRNPLSNAPTGFQNQPQGGDRSIPGRVWDWAKDNISYEDLLKLGVTGYGLYTAHKGMKESDADRAIARGLADESLQGYRNVNEFAQGQWNDRSPLRDAFMQNIFQAQDPTNPFARSFGNPGGQLTQPSGPPSGEPPPGTQTGGGAHGPRRPNTGGRVPGDPAMRAASVKPGGSGLEELLELEMMR